MDFGRCGAPKTTRRRLYWKLAFRKRKDASDVVRNWSLDREFKPQMDRATSDRLYARWKDAVKRALDWETPDAS